MIEKLKQEETDRENHNSKIKLPITTLVGLCKTFCTTPYCPFPSSPRSVSCGMEMAYDDPFEKLHPSACRMALPEKLSFPDGSL
jgi:hypothetical protein